MSKKQYCNSLCLDTLPLGSRRDLIIIVAPVIIHHITTAATCFLVVVVVTIFFVGQLLIPILELGRHHKVILESIPPARLGFGRGDIPGALILRRGRRFGRSSAVRLGGIGLEHVQKSALGQDLDLLGALAPPAGRGRGSRLGGRPMLGAGVLPHLVLVLGDGIEQRHDAPGGDAAVGALLLELQGDGALGDRRRRRRLGPVLLRRRGREGLARRRAQRYVHRRQVGAPPLPALLPEGRVDRLLLLLQLLQRRPGFGQDDRSGGAGRWPAGRCLLRRRRRRATKPHVQDAGHGAGHTGALAGDGREGGVAALELIGGLHLVVLVGSEFVLSIGSAIAILILVIFVVI
mmetsp:Transcript_18248/g.52190  ORF Transcript_18248/g.52190 Transcript_18248/m.52190 type:complete len:347 (-) Transcript_18248:644-1684(-)